MDNFFADMDAQKIQLTNAGSPRALDLKAKVIKKRFKCSIKGNIKKPAYAQAEKSFSYTSFSCSRAIEKLVKKINGCHQ